ncbi:hypothetical protein AZ034_002855, partial [Pluralibacter gergoviae]
MSQNLSLIHIWMCIRDRPLPPPIGRVVR